MKSFLSMERGACVVMSNQIKVIRGLTDYDGGTSTFLTTKGFHCLGDQLLQKSYCTLGRKKLPMVAFQARSALHDIDHAVKTARNCIDAS